MAHPHGRYGARFPGIAATATPLDAVAAVEALACDAIVTTPAYAGEVERAVESAGTNARDDDVHVVQCHGARDAIEKATELGARGGRVSVFLHADELLDGVGALARAISLQVPLLVHVFDSDADGMRPGRDEIGPALGIGAGIVVSGTVQQAADLVLATRRAAEDSELPFLHVADAPLRPADLALPERTLVAGFLGPRSASKAKPPIPLRADAKRRERAFASRAPFALKSAMRALAEESGRPLGPVTRMSGNDIEEVIVAIGRGASVARPAVEQLRREGRRVGFVAAISMQPFFGADLIRAIANADAVVVLEPLDLAMAPAGPFATMLKAAFVDAITWTPGFPGVGKIPPIVSATVATLDRPLIEDDIRSLVAELDDGERARRVVVFGTADEDASPKLPLRTSVAGRGIRLH